MTLVIPNAGGPTSIPVFAAEDLGIFRKHGLKVTVTVIGNEATAMAALSKGEVDFGAAIGSIAHAAERGLPVRVLLVWADRPPFVLLGAKGVQSVTQLKGKSVALYSPGSTGSEVGIALLSAEGLRASDYRVDYAGGNPAHVALLKAQKVGATLLDAPTAVPLIHQGYRVLASAIQKVQLPEAGLGASLAEIRDHPAVVRRMVAALMEATQVVRTQKAAVVAVMAKHLAESQADAAEGYDLIHGIWTVDGRPGPASLSFEFRLDVQQLKLKQPPQQSQIYDLSFLPPAPAASAS